MKYTNTRIKMQVGDKVRVISIPEGWEAKKYLIGKILTITKNPVIYNDKLIYTPNNNEFYINFTADNFELFSYECEIY